MNTWWIVVAVVVAITIVTIAAVLIIGLSLPVSHTVSRSVRLRQPPQDVYFVVRNFRLSSEWRPGVKNVDVTEGENGATRFREEGSNGVINYELVEDLPNERLVTRITDTNLGFGGSWIYEIAPDAGGGSRVTITENGQVSNIFFRFMSRYVFGHTATIDAYLKALAARFDDSTAKPE